MRRSAVGAVFLGRLCERSQAGGAALVRTLAAANFPAGRHQLVWDGKDGAGRTRPGGVYFVRARVGEFENRHKVLKLE